MPSFLENEIRTQLRRYVRGEISLESFEEWLAPRIWTIEASNDPAAEDLAYAIDLRLAEHSSGHWTDTELRDLLNQLDDRIAQRL
jgi:hypothetical protein